MRSTSHDGGSIRSSPHPLAELSVKDVRDIIPPAARRRSLIRGLAFFTVSLAVYVVTFLAIAIPRTFALQVALAMTNGVFIAMLFVVGHDACHGSLTPYRALNHWLGRLAFLPSLHPYASWEYSHNGLHHGWTNLRGKDPGYPPLTVAEYGAMSPWQRWCERRYRSWLGMLPLYLVTIWWRHEIRPTGAHRLHIVKRRGFALDRALVCFVPILQSLGLLAALSWRHGDPWRHVLAAVILGTIIPFLTFTWMIGFATFQHHTHPRVIWYDDAAEWSFFRSQVQGTVHIVFPRCIELMLHNIMEHTAHHVDMRVPLYGLTNAQRVIEQTFGHENVITEPFSVAGMARTFATCQLYDYSTHQWLSFAGVPTTLPLQR